MFIVSKKVGSIHDTQILNIIFVILPDNLSIITNDTHGTPGNIYITRNNYAQQGTKTTLLFLPTTGEASWLLLPNSITLLSGSTVPPKNTYSSILKVTGQV